MGLYVGISIGAGTLITWFTRSTLDIVRFDDIDQGVIGESGAEPCVDLTAFDLVVGVEVFKTLHSIGLGSENSRGVNCQGLTPFVNVVDEVLAPGTRIIGEQGLIGGILVLGSSIKVH
jgi:hypothetical protein